MGKLFLIICAGILPSLFLLYALYKKKIYPFLLGALAFTISQYFIRMPILQYLAKENSTYQLWNVTKPVIILFLLAISAGIFEEFARLLAIRYLLKQRTLQNGIVFGLGHGGIEAFLLVGIPILTTSVVHVQQHVLFLSGIERLCAMLIHICLSVLVLMAVRQQKFLYCVYAILLHGIINFTVSYIGLQQPIIVVEIVLILLTISLIFMTYQITRRNFQHEEV